MKRSLKRGLGVAAASLLLSVSVPLAAQVAALPADDVINGALVPIYASYTSGVGAAADWELPIFSARTQQLIDSWREKNNGELTELSSYGWFCECQDWDETRFGVGRKGAELLPDGRMAVTVLVNPGGDEAIEQRLIMVDEDGRWMLDDLFSASTGEGGLRAAIEQELADGPDSDLGESSEEAADDTLDETLDAAPDKAELPEG